MSGQGEMGASGSEGASQDHSEAAEEVDLSPEFQAQVRALAKSLTRINYYELLGIDPDSDADAVRDAFFERSKLFHPDRYFNKHVGAYGPLLTEIYKRVVAANDVLRDPELRKSYDRLVAASGFGARARSGSTPRVSPEPTAPAPRGPSLRERTGLRSRSKLLEGLEKQLEKSRSRAKQLLEEAVEHKEAGSWERAASLLKRALAFDPRDQSIHDELAEVVLQANAVRGEEALARGRAMLKRGEQEAAIEVLVEAAQLRPTDGELAASVAELLFGAKKLNLARDFAKRAVSLDSQSVRAHKILGQVLKGLGDVAQARKHLQRAWELDPMDRDVRAELQSL